MNNAIEIKDLSFNIEERAILENISFTLQEADIACLLGPSGCGKTTLLRCIVGFEKQHQGEVWIKGVRASNPKHQLPVEQRLGRLGCKGIMECHESLRLPGEKACD